MNTRWCTHKGSIEQPISLTAMMKCQILGHLHMPRLVANDLMIRGKSTSLELVASWRNLPPIINQATLILVSRWVGQPMISTNIRPFLHTIKNTITILATDKTMAYPDLFDEEPLHMNKTTTLWARSIWCQDNRIAKGRPCAQLSMSNATTTLEVLLEVKNRS